MFMIFECEIYTKNVSTDMKLLAGSGPLFQDEGYLMATAVSTEPTDCEYLEGCSSDGTRAAHSADPPISSICLFSGNQPCTGYWCLLNRHPVDLLV